MNLSKTLLCAVIGAAAIPSFAASDNFNRTALGSNWAPLMGVNARIVNDKFVAGLAYMNFTPAAADNRATVTIASTAKDLGHYGGLYVGKASVKFRTGINSKQFANVCFEPTILSGLSAAGQCFNTFTPFASARVTLTTTGTVARIDIDTNQDGATDYSFSYDFGASLGAGVGLMANNEVFTLDNLDTGHGN